MENVKAKVGDKIVIKALAKDKTSNLSDPSAYEYAGKVGVVESIDDAGNLHGTWGSLGILPEDEYEVLGEGETVHRWEADCCDPIIYVLPRQLYDLLDQVYETGNANCDCSVDDHGFIGN